MWIKLEGIYDFVSNNNKLVCDRLTDEVEYGSILSYKKGMIFNCNQDTSISHRQYIRIETKWPDDSSSQGHSNIYHNDIIDFSNKSEIVRTIVISLYKEHKREKKLSLILEKY